MLDGIVGVIFWELFAMQMTSGADPGRGGGGAQGAQAPP